MNDTDDQIVGRRRAAVAALRLDFAAGLPERLAFMRDALTQLGQRDDADQREILHRQVHSLKGTAAAYGATDVSACARILEARARVWVESGGVVSAELPLAREELDRLADAVTAYQAAVAAEEP